MRYLSVCSGIEAASQAWGPLGWTPVAFSEIEKFPSAVLAHHYPDVPNWGDMTKFEEWPDATVDVLCGGTPCQSFSVAGLRQGLADHRGNLMLTFGAIAGRYRPKWLVWENVPGVLSSNGGRDFGTFLGMLGQLGYGFAYRVLDAQHVRTQRFPFAVPQRRRRVWVVGYLGDWRRAASVLFDRESLSGHHPPRRGTRKGIAVSPDLRAQSQSSHRLDSEAFVPVSNSGDVGYCLTARAQGSLDWGLICADVAPTLNAHFGDKQGLENQHINGGCGLFVANTLRGEGFDASEDGTGRQNLVPVAIQERAISENPNAGPDGAGVKQDGTAYTIEARTVPQAVAHQITLMQRGRADGPSIEWRQDGSANALLTPNGGRAGLGVGAVAFVQNTRDEVRLMGGDGQVAGALAAEPGAKQQCYLSTPWAVRRLTPTECERLQGFPDGFTQIPWRGKPAENCPDGPRYKALGNTWAVNVADWIGERIQHVDRA